MRYILPMAICLLVIAPGCKQEPKNALQPASSDQPPARPLKEIEPLAPPPPAQTAESTSPPATERTTPTEIQTDSRQYTIQKGDTLWSIAKTMLGDGKRYKEIVELNPGLEPTKLPIGKTIQLPEK